MKKQPVAVRPRQKQLRREAILSAARALVTEVGYGAVTLEMVADRAEVTKPTLYAYFENRDDLILAAYLRVLEASQVTRSDLSPADTPLTRLSTVVRRVLEANFADPESMYAWPPQQIATHPKFIVALNQIRDDLEELVSEGQRMGEIAADLDPPAAIQCYFSIAGGYATLNRLIEDGVMSKEELIDQLHRFIVQSFRPPID